MLVCSDDARLVSMRVVNEGVSGVNACEDDSGGRMTLSNDTLGWLCMYSRAF